MFASRYRYGRVVGKAVYGGKDVDLALVREGMCWWYRHYAHEQPAADRVLYEDAEAKARGKGLGVVAGSESGAAVGVAEGAAGVSAQVP
jgi:endonuclease YncB( thermonuclease family)